MNILAWLFFLVIGSSFLFALFVLANFIVGYKKSSWKAKFTGAQAELRTKVKKEILGKPTSEDIEKALRKQQAAINFRNRMKEVIKKERAWFHGK